MGLVASLVAEHDKACGLQELPLPGSRAQAHCGHGLSCSMAGGIYPDQGLNPCLLHWQADSLPLSHRGSPELTF